MTQFRELLAQYRPFDDTDSETLNRFLELSSVGEECFDSRRPGAHVTGSCWLLNPTRTKILLTHHRKLRQWLQLGGHADGSSDILGVALREAEEESGILGIQQLAGNIFDLDIHLIPARGEVLAHEHFDVRFALIAPSEEFVISHESLELKWVAIDELEKFNSTRSVLRMRDKWNMRSQFLPNATR